MTLVVIALDDFAMRVETDSPLAPGWLLHVAEKVQDETRARHQVAMRDLALYGRSPPPDPEVETT